MTADLRLDPVAPPVTEFIAMRAALGWGRLTETEAQMALTASLAHASCWSGSTLAGFGRLVGDGVVYFYVQDIVVAPGFQRRGIGTDIVTALLRSARARASHEGTVGLMAVPGAEAFYGKFGFATRPCAGVGPGMTCAISELRI